MFERRIDVTFMRYRIHSHNDIHLDYCLSGKNPRIFITAGIHGDELGVIDSLEKAVGKYASRLPSYLFVPRMCPSAILQKTRVNRDGVDINRHFFNDAPVREVQAIQSLFREYHFITGFSFHEDPCQDCFYMYDSAHFVTKKARARFVGELGKMGVQLFDGVDDPEDATLGHRVRRGIVHVPPGREHADKGTFESWAIGNVIVQHIIVPEVPGKSLQAIKDKLVDAFFRRVILGEKYL